MVALTTRSLRRKAKNLCDPRAEEVRSVRFAKRGLPLTAWNDECVQTISQRRRVTCFATHRSSPPWVWKTEREYTMNRVRGLRDRSVERPRLTLGQVTLQANRLLF